MNEQELCNYEIMCLFSNSKIKLEKENRINRLNQQLKDQKNDDETIKELQKKLLETQQSYEKIKKTELIQRIQDLFSIKVEEKEFEKNKLSWPVELENYLLFHAKVSPKQIQQIEKVVQQSLAQYQLINLDKERKIKLRKVKEKETPKETASK